MERLLNRSYVRTDNARFDKALYWAKISMDALIMNQRGKGIFAGLPWFDNYWGRDSFISLAGATLVTGDFEDARDILRSFAEWQDTNPASMNYGRIPNLVTANSLAYNTADGTPRFVIALNDYIRYSGDTAFARTMYPVVKRSIEGTIQYHMDSLCFLTHGDAETWMDAVGPDGPWSPRGNRANDVQALWYEQLRVGMTLAPGSEGKITDQWSSIRETLLRNFNTHFIDSSSASMYDHLREDGSPDRQVRPNQLFALKLVSDDQMQTNIFRSVTEHMVYQHGIASLWQDDEHFHPYHHYQPYYVQDAAYHNGIVWAWLAGQWIDIATEYGLSDLAFQVSENMVDQILDRGAVGTISELRDAVPRPGEGDPRRSGTYSQAWSLAEFIRNFYQSYLGVTASGVASGLALRPQLPGIFSRAHFQVELGSHSIEIDYRMEADSMKMLLSSPASDNDIDVSITEPFRSTFRSPIPPNSLRSGQTKLPSHGNMTLKFDKKGIYEFDGRRSTYLENHPKMVSTGPARFGDLQLATPLLRPGLRALKGPLHRLLTNSEIKRTNSRSKVLYDVRDSEGDDNGTGSYLYPQTTNLKPGSLDVTHFTVSADNTNNYFTLRFKNLSNPGWHPEYGFQLTYIAIAINKDGKPGSGQTHVGMNSQYILDKNDAFENIIYVGGGVRVVNDSGRILAEYLPAEGDEKNPLGNAVTKTIRFSIPNEIIGRADSSWRYTVLVGCQDDHGGAGIGEFRTVEADAKEWVGGGKKNSADPNVYDVLLPKRR